MTRHNTASSLAASANGVMQCSFQAPGARAQMQTGVWGSSCDWVWMFHLQIISFDEAFWLLLHPFPRKCIIIVLS